MLKDFEDQYIGTVSNDGLPFTVNEFRRRLKFVQDRMDENDIDILFVTTPENIYYLTGYRTTGYYFYQALIVLKDRDPVFIVRYFEVPVVKGLSWAKDCVGIDDTEDQVEATARALKSLGADGARIGYEEKGFFTPPGILDGLRSKLSGATFVQGGGIVELSRRVKSPAEIDYLRKAAAIAGVGMAAGIAEIALDRTENEAVAAMYNAMIRAGGEHPSGGPYVSAGPRSALPHQYAERTPFRPGELIFLECGGCYRRYGASVLRIASIANPPPEVTDMADVMHSALDAIIAAIRPGVTSGQVDEAGRSIARKHGLDRYWLHRAAYSMGVGFPPGWGEGHVMDIKPNDPRALEAGMAFHLVPVLLVPKVGAVGFSETVLVTPSGVDVLTDFQPGLIKL